MDTRHLRVIELSGTPRQRGRAHGEELRDDIRQMIEKKKDALRVTVGAEPDQYISDFLAYARFDEAIRVYAPDLWEEVDGLSEGAGISLDIARFLQLTDEDWTYREKIYRDRAVGGDACTAFAVNTDRVTLAGQNLDTAYIDPHQVLFRITYPDSDMESWIFSVAGKLGLNGMNNVPLGLCCNTLLQVCSCAEGVPVALIVRRVLECDSFDEAAAFITRISHASGQNYIIAAPSRVASFECSAGQVTALEPGVSIDGICHTNHPFANDDLEARQLTRRSRFSSRQTNSSARLSSIERRFAEAGPRIRMADVKRALGAHDDSANPVCRHFDAGSAETLMGYTAGSMIYELDPENPVFHVASGPPCQTEFRSFHLSGNGESRRTLAQPAGERSLREST